MTDLEVYQPPAPLAVPAAQASDFDSWIAVAGQVVKLAREICDTPFVPDGLRGSAPAVAAAILAGRELRLPPITSLQHVHVIKGKVGHSALLMRALIMSEGHQWDDVDVSDTRAVVRGRRKGESQWTEVSFTVQQAQKARLDLGLYPQDKLYARATVRLARRKFGDVILGMPYIAEELEDGEMPDDGITGQAVPAIEPPGPAPRTARRAAPRTPGPAESPGAAKTANPAGSGEKSVSPAGPGPDLPALPGEDEPPDPTAGPGQDTGSPPSASASGEPRATGGQVGIIARHFRRLGFTDADRDERLSITSEIAGRAVDSTKELTQPEAKTVADTLSRCRTREQLVTLAGSGQDGSDG